MLSNYFKDKVSSYGVRSFNSSPAIENKRYKIPPSGVIKKI